MNTLELFASALASTQALAEKYPNDQAVVPVINQLRFLIELEEGKRAEWERLKDINIGVLTVREIEPLDQSLAELLYQVVDAVGRMQSQHRSSRA